MQYIKKYFQNFEDSKLAFPIIYLSLIIVPILIVLFLEKAQGNLIFDSIDSALKYLLIAFVISWYFSFLKDKINKNGIKKVMWEGFLYCGFVALILTSYLGDPSCIESEQDNRGSTCLEHADDGYTPTSQQMYAEFVFWFILFYLPLLTAVYKGNKDRVL